MYGRSGCAEVVGFFIMTMAILAVFALVVGAVGSSPVIDSSGFHWDNSARITESNNRTQVAITRSNNETEQSRIFWETVKTIGVAVAIAAVLIVTVVQRGRTMRTKAEMKAYIAAAYPQAQIEKRGGAVVLVDYGRHEIVTLDAVKQEMHALTGPVSDRQYRVEWE